MAIPLLILRVQKPKRQGDKTMNRTIVTHYHTNRISSERTHEDIIDVNFDDIRIFISFEQGRDLISRVAVALATPFKGASDE